jgi:hypothetical protein
MLIDRLPFSQYSLAAEQFVVSEFAIADLCA